MSSPEPGGQPRPLRVAGLALVGVAVAAAIAGIVALIIDNDDTAAPPPTSTATATSATVSPPAGTTTPGAPPGATTTAPAPSPSQSGAPSPAPTTAPAPAPPPVTAVPVRVYNNSRIQGLAARAAEDFRRAGWGVVEVSNYPGGIIPTSTVYFRPGTEEEAAARALGNRFDLRIEPRFPGIAQAGPGLIVIVTNDYGVK